MKQGLYLVCGLLLLVNAQQSMACNCAYTITQSGTYNNSTLHVQPGQTICIQAGHYDFLKFIGFVGTAAQPIRFVNCGGQVGVGANATTSGIQFTNSSYFALTGSGDAAIPYGFLVDKSYSTGSSGVSVGGASTEYEVERVEVSVASYTGFFMKLDPGCDSTTWRDNYTIRNVRIHDNYVHNTGGPGMFIGSGYSATTGATITCNGTTKTVYPVQMTGLQVYNNRIDLTTGVGLNINNAPNASVYNNTLVNTSLGPVPAGWKIGGSAGCGCDYTITKADTYNNARLGVKPGQTVCIQAGQYNYLRLSNFVGSTTQPIRFMNCGGQVTAGTTTGTTGIVVSGSQYFVLSGAGDSNSFYGIKLTQSNGTNGNAMGVSVSGLSSDCEIDHIEVAAANFAGIMVKTDPTCDPATWRENFTMYNVKLHDNYIHDTGGEGMYIGNSFYDGFGVTCDGVAKTVYPHLIQGLEVYNNRIERTGAEGLQYGCAPDAQVHHNRLEYTGISPFANYQNNGLQISSGSGGDCYSNSIRHVAGTGLAILGHLGNGRIFNNVIYDVGQDGIFCDDRPGSLSNTSMAFLNNTISKTGRDGIRLYNEINVNTIANNVITRPNATPSLNGKAFVFAQGATASMSANFTAASASTAGFENDSTDFHLKSGSPLIDFGINVSSWRITVDLDGNPRDTSYDIGAYEYVAGNQGTNATNSAYARVGATPQTDAQTAVAGAYSPEESTSKVVIYPSPAYSQITFQLPQGQVIDQVSIYNAMGQLVITQRSERVDRMTFSVANLLAGTYIFDLIKSPLQTVRGRFVKL
ncbi:right-handed parallel beta-helix repeat-containing protein [Spirosoma pollinicola]|uniref:Uncharacterized protein n=1 Tax=Spirosoma pollinicola TaxID=2057025 RepID=A0A2K8Z7E6_9BACT|nr:right-handed parallel beta-helix repeat-containing protein [Spirosoma pollinicola]AUD05739.1 hypothetical protein CWM47_30180 [Spirosoma pollinicola]